MCIQVHELTSEELNARNVPWIPTFKSEGSIPANESLTEIRFGLMLVTAPRLMGIRDDLDSSGGVGDSFSFSCFSISSVTIFRFSFFEPRLELHFQWIRLN